MFMNDFCTKANLHLGSIIIRTNTTWWCMFKYLMYTSNHLWFHNVWAKTFCIIAPSTPRRSSSRPTTRRSSVFAVAARPTGSGSTRHNPDRWPRFTIRRCFTTIFLHPLKLRLGKYTQRALVWPDVEIKSFPIVCPKSYHISIYLESICSNSPLGHPLFGILF